MCTQACSPVAWGCKWKSLRSPAVGSTSIIEPTEQTPFWAASFRGVSIRDGVVCVATEPVYPSRIIAPKSVGQHKLESMGKGQEERRKKEEKKKEEKEEEETLKLGEKG